MYIVCAKGTYKAFTAGFDFNWLVCSQFSKFNKDFIYIFTYLCFPEYISTFVAIPKSYVKIGTYLYFITYFWSQSQRCFFLHFSQTQHQSLIINKVLNSSPRHFFYKWKNSKYVLQSTPGMLRTGSISLNFIELVYSKH